jgi:hypothetical protein
MKVPIGVSNRVSSNLNFNLNDALQYAQQSGFEIMQILLTADLLKQYDSLIELLDLVGMTDFDRLYFHAETSLNCNLNQNDLIRHMDDILLSEKDIQLIFHFDENEDLEKMLESIEKLPTVARGHLYLENALYSPHPSDISRKIKKYLAVFSLANIQTISIKPAFNIPALFVENSQLNEKEAIQWCCEIFNFFETKRIPLLLMLSDRKELSQEGSVPRAIGEGSLPYEHIFNFVKKSQVTIEGIILQYGDKINPLKSRDKLVQLFK